MLVRMIMLMLFGAISGCSHVDPVDSKMGEAWLPSGKPPAHQQRMGTPNATLMTDADLWSLVAAADPTQHRVVVALKSPGEPRGHFRGEILVDRGTLNSAIASLKDFLHQRDLPGPTEAGAISLPRGRQLPLITVGLRTMSDLVVLRKLPFVDYVEPSLFFLDSLACGFDPWAPESDPRAQDEEINGFGWWPDLLPYSYQHHSVQQAWERWLSAERSDWWIGLPGANQGVAILDSGVSTYQDDFFSEYTKGAPTRAPQHRRINETSEEIDDICFHGTKVASIAAAPRSGLGVAGIAFASDLTTVKIAHSPLAGKSDVGAVCRALADVVSPDATQLPRVVAMAFGLTYFSPTIASCIESAFLASPSTVFVAAAGSTVTNVVFPANHKPFVTAVSMVEISPSGAGYRLMGRPLTVSYGPEVDFVSVSTLGGIPAAGPVGSTRGGNQIARFRWSSASTGMHAGMFAFAAQLADQRNWSRAQFLSALRQSASRDNITDFGGEPLENVVGAGIIDMYRATGGFRKAEILAPYQAEAGATVTLIATTDAVEPPGAKIPTTAISYEWLADGASLNSKTSAATFVMPSAGSVEFKVFANDTLGYARAPFVAATHRIDIVSKVGAVSERQLYWRSHVADFATFFNGGRHDRVVNAAKRLPAGCGVQGVRGILSCGQAPNAYCQSEIPYQGSVTRDAGNIGFTVSRAGGLPGESLEVQVHQWHDGLSAVRTKVIYDVIQPAGVDCLAGNEDTLFDGP